MCSAIIVLLVSSSDHLSHTDTFRSSSASEKATLVVIGTRGASNEIWLVVVFTRETLTHQHGPQTARFSDTDITDILRR